jgi:hypothetical protein
MLNMSRLDIRKLNLRDTFGDVTGTDFCVSKSFSLGHSLNCKISGFSDLMSCNLSLLCFKENLHRFIIEHEGRCTLMKSCFSSGGGPIMGAIPGRTGDFTQQTSMQQLKAMALVMHKHSSKPCCQRNQVKIEWYL